MTIASSVGRCTEISSPSPRATLPGIAHSRPRREDAADRPRVAYSQEHRPRSGRAPAAAAPTAAPVRSRPLVYSVHPLPQSMLDDVWDFGSLESLPPPRADEVAAPVAAVEAAAPVEAAVPEEAAASVEGRQRRWRRQRWWWGRCWRRRRRRWWPWRARQPCIRQIHRGYAESRQIPTGEDLHREDAGANRIRPGNVSVPTRKAAAVDADRV